MSNAALLRRSPHKTARRGPAALDRRHTKRSTREFLNLRGVSQARTLEDYILLTHAAIESGHPAPCPVCEEGVITAVGCSSCGAELI